MKEYHISVPMKAGEAIRKLYPESSRRTLQNWLRAGRFFANGKKLVRENEDLVPGQTVSSEITFRPPLPCGLTVLFEDRDLIAIEKPEGLLSVPLDVDEGLVKKHALGLLRDHYQTDQIFAVHRIDRGTSGCLLFARGSESEARLKTLFERHDLTREYFAIIEGHLLKDRGMWQSRLLELPNYNVVESPEGKEAITHFSVLRRSRKYTYVKLQLETGRKHQIRVHCSAAGHPVLGDARYGSCENPIRRICLHACTLELIHPFIKNKKVTIRSSLPAEFARLVKSLKEP